ncbi:taurine ABC transporter substrate-binding protein [Thermus scotoductus]|uniref:ABC transporter substrate-binding protein n=1 Tax=Thermus scotoductus TaxID=37636 RepID=UPI000F811784|nr:ABC transporter substrate-binding protein [Thermus scotoductus]RTH33243.1 taurine ABC transporter substrate-binding protein [Thermus scotoductus]
MDCCVDRRRVVQGLSGLALGGLGWAQRGRRRLRLAFCSQLLCIIPYEVALRRGYFAEEGLEVELVYARGGSQALQFLVGRAVDYAATSLDAALQAYRQGAPILRFCSTGRLPLFALAAAPKSAVKGLKDLEGKTVGVSALGNADHVLLVYLLRKAGVDPKRVQYATLGPNLYEALRAGHVEVGMVQEPALTLLKEAGGRELVNLMDLRQARTYLGGPYEFMGVAVRREERQGRLEEMRALSRALEKALRFIHAANAHLIADTLPKALIAGGDEERLRAVIERYRKDLYPTRVRIDLEAARRVAESQMEAGPLPPSFRVESLLDLEVLGASG